MVRNYGGKVLTVSCQQWARPCGGGTLLELISLQLFQIDWGVICIIDLPEPVLPTLTLR